MSSRIARKSSLALTGSYYDTVVVTKSHFTFDIATNARLFGGSALLSNEYSGYGVLEHEAGHNGNTYNIDGSIKGAKTGILTQGQDTQINVLSNADVAGGYIVSGSQFGQGGIVAAGANSSINIARGGEVSGMTAVAVLGDESRVTNNGDIAGAQYGMSIGIIGSDGSLSADHATLINNGTVTGMIGIIASGTGSTVVNGARGVIIGDAAGITAGGASDLSFVNHGTVRTMASATMAAADAIQGSFGADKIINDGKVFGTIDLLGGNDSIDMRGGYARGLIIGGYGNDTLTVDNNKYKLSEVAEGGIDTVKSTVSYRLSDNVERLYLLGKADINAIGNASDNILKGNSGDNVLTGGAGADTFIFGTNSGTDTITDFTHGTDKIDLSHWKGISDFNEMVDHSHYTSSQASVTLGDDTLIIKLAADAVLTPDDFIFG